MLALTGDTVDNIPSAGFGRKTAAKLLTEHGNLNGLLANVDPHAPAHYRANIPMSNFEPFAAAFDIEEGSPMARPAAERARIW